MALGKVKWGNSDKNFDFRVCCLPQTDSTHNAYAVGYSNHSLSITAQQLLPNVQLFIVEGGNGCPSQKSADGAILTWHSIACIFNNSSTTAHAYEDSTDI